MQLEMQTQLMYVLRLVVSAVLGAIIGYEREVRGRDAGVRTFAAVAVGTCAFAIVSEIVASNGTEATRITSQVVTAVGFLGAGVILRGPSHISGLTTSATMWAASAAAMAVGYGLYTLGIAITVLLLLLLLLRYVPGLERHKSEDPPHDAATSGEPRLPGEEPH